MEEAEKGEGEGRGSPRFHRVQPHKTASDDQAKALKKGGQRTNPLPESGGGSWQISHGEPCCGARGTLNEFR